MKKLNRFLAVGLIMALLGACNQDYVDPISSADPGSDEVAPIVTAISPLNGEEVNAPNDLSDVEIQFEVSDDIELASVEVSLNGSSLGSYDSFNDYRRFVANYEETLGLGDYDLVITATDLSGKTTNTTISFTKINTIRELMAESIFHVSFNEDFTEVQNMTEATVVGTPSIDPNGVDGSCYSGSVDSYLTYPTTNIEVSSFSASMFIMIDESGDPNRAGVLIASAEADNNNDRTTGFRFFREDASGNQRYKLNVGNGTADSWFDGGANADVEPNTGNWVHFAFTIDDTSSKVYIDGEVVSEGDFTGIDWTNVDVLAVMSGEPYWTDWGHLADESKLDELLIYDRVLSQDEIQLLGQLL